MSTTSTQAANHARIDDLPDAFDGMMRLVRAGLGITSFGVQLLDLPAGVSTPSTTRRPLGRRSCTSPSPEPAR